MGAGFTSPKQPATSSETPVSWKIDQRLLDKTEQLLRHRQSITVLEAGCGSQSHFAFTGRVEMHGIDISQEELDKNYQVEQKILGDIQSYPLPRSQYDVVVCWDVIEHLCRPRDALLNMFLSVKPDGLVLLGFPNLISFKGLATKITPAWLHRLYYRVMRGDLGYDFHPFKTYLRWEILPRNVLKFANQNGFAAELYNLEEGAVQKRLRTRVWPAKALFSIIQACVQLLSLGGAPSLYLDYCMIVPRKQVAE